MRVEFEVEEVFYTHEPGMLKSGFRVAMVILHGEQRAVHRAGALIYETRQEADAAVTQLVAIVEIVLHDLLREIRSQIACMPVVIPRNWPAAEQRFRLYAMPPRQERRTETHE